jgi:hypothetical protein
MATACSRRIWIPVLRAHTASVTLRRPFATQAKDMSALSNRQKFNQLQPPPSVFTKLEKLGFGELRRTSRYASLRKVAAKDKDQNQAIEPEYRVG